MRHKLSTKYFYCVSVSARCTIFIKLHAERSLNQIKRALSQPLQSRGVPSPDRFPTQLHNIKAHDLITIIIRAESIFTWCTHIQLKALIISLKDERHVYKYIIPGRCLVHNVLCAQSKSLIKGPRFFSSPERWKNLSRQRMRRDWHIGSRGGWLMRAAPLYWTLCTHASLWQLLVLSVYVY